jgi:hypothetical protein
VHAPQSGTDCGTRWLWITPDGAGLAGSNGELTVPPAETGRAGPGVGGDVSADEAGELSGGAEGGGPPDATCRAGWGADAGTLLAEPERPGCGAVGAGLDPARKTGCGAGGVGIGDAPAKPGEVSPLATGAHITGNSAVRVGTTETDVTAHPTPARLLTETRAMTADPGLFIKYPSLRVGETRSRDRWAAPRR